MANTVVTVDGPNNSQVDFTVTLFPAMSSEVVTVQYATVDGTAVAGKDYLAAQGVLTFEPGQSTVTVPITLFGALTPEPTKQFSLMLSNANPSGTPISIAQATATILNAVVVPVVSIDSVQVSRPASGTTPAIFTVSLSEPTEEVVSVNYATANGTAISGTDYQSEIGTLTFAPDQTTAQIVVPVIGSTLYNMNLTFSVTLTMPIATTLSPFQSAGTGTIVNQVSAPSLTITDPVLIKGVAGTSPAVFTVELSAPSALTTTVRYATANETAVAGTDYLPESGQVTFPPGDTSQSISVPVVGDHVLTGTLMFVVNLSLPVNAVVAQSQATATILDNNSLVVTTPADDGPGSLRWAILTANATPGMNTITFQIPGGATRPSM